MVFFVNFSPTSSHLRPLQVENCDSNLRLVVDEDDNGKFRPERVKVNSGSNGTVAPTKKTTKNVFKDIYLLTTYRKLGLLFNFCPIFEYFNLPQTFNI